MSKQTVKPSPDYSQIAAAMLKLGMKPAAFLFYDPETEMMATIEAADCHPAVRRMLKAEFGAADEIDVEDIGSCNP